MNAEPPRLICLTPVKNEAWILRQFLAAASRWADQIVVADQQSDDDSRAICEEFPKATLVDNRFPGYDEAARQALLIETARDLCPGPRVLLALDADEALSGEFLNETVRGRLFGLAPGTVLRFRWANLLPGVGTYHNGPPLPIGFVDDGRSHVGSTLHSARVPTGDNCDVWDSGSVRLLHYQLTNEPRMRSKHRWYKCFERVTYPNKPIAAIEQLYTWMDRVERAPRPCPESWFAPYEEAGIEMRSVPEEDDFWWDREVLRMFAEHGVDRFRALDIWNFDWEAARRRWAARGVDGLPDGPIVSLARRRHAVGHRLLAAARPGRRGRLAQTLARRLLNS
ncbi:glycosyltransferase family 2 protein [Alienimonas sp. DA493]|uniref:glycosyltransferase family 2 protein n=1 Tax=Alienimonas sp. DA493 TaxID=3373605 RepID=UPI003754611C